MGTGRDRADIAAALLFSIRQHEPNKIIFLCSERTKEETIPFLKKELCSFWHNCIVCSFGKENDVQFLYQAYVEEMKKYDDVVVDFTSGTKAMSAAAFAAAIAIEADKVSYITGPRDSTGRVTKSTGLAAFQPDLVIAERQLERSQMFFSNLDFYAAWQLADRYRRTLPDDSRLKAWAKTLYMVAKAYDLWDHFKWKEAAHLLSKAANPREGLVGVDCEQLTANSQICKQIAAQPFGYERLVDLCNNACRRFRQGRYDDALSRLYRAYEYLVQNRLKNGFGITDTGKIRIVDLKAFALCDATKEKFENRAATSGGTLSLGLQESLELLAELDDDLGREMTELYWSGDWKPGKKMNVHKSSGPLQNWLKQRNSSYLAHGTDPAKKDTVKCMLNEYNRLLIKAIPEPEFKRISKAACFVKL